MSYIMQQHDLKNDGQDEKATESFKYSLFRSISEAKDAKTAVLLLQSADKSILLAIVEALSKYASKSKDNAKILFNFGVINNILPIIEHEDTYIRRFAGKLLTEVIAVPNVTSYFIESDYVEYLVKLLMTEKDIFMQEYLSAILAQLSKDPCGNVLLIKYCSSLNLFFEGLQSPDPDINKHNLEILQNLMQDPVGAREISRNEKFNFPLLYKHCKSIYPEIQCLALDIIIDVIARNKDEDIQYLFLETNGVEVLLDFLKNDDWNNLHIKVLKILSFAAENPVVVDKLIDSESIPQILNYIKRAENPTFLAEALRIIVHVANTFRGRKVILCNVLHSYEITEYLIGTLRKSIQSDVVEVTCYAFGEIMFFSPAARELTNTESVETILGCSTYPFIDEFKIVCCNLLSILCLEQNGRHYFLKANGLRRMFALITDAHSISVRNAALQFMQAISTDLNVAKAFVENKYLSYMLNNRSFSRTIILWNTCIETLLKSHLPIKFALTGRLSLHDLTQDGFYISRKNIYPFPMLDDAFRSKFSLLEPIYMINCMRHKTSKTFQNNAAFESNKCFVTNTNTNTNQFYIYISLLFVQTNSYIHMIYSSAERNTDIGSINIQCVLSRVKMLARFVARQMSGVDSTGTKCIDRQLEVHLKQIKESLETSVIPLGQLRVGSYLERALLFKTIADRICLPTALVRGEYGVSWIEVAIPQVISTIQDCRLTTYPIKLIKPNFIVDLMDSPGDLIPIGSSRSKLYCIKKTTCNKTCCY
ncbi:uncharacterized protein LOC105837002 [Monomorium pharaonis]|uniref:uncharacterized protein LOC105837002 n=1 Tax=Monomorium pharaonis TaxID=307658 RepID=UPI0017472132|nr:uncharacterized protein LOC105837002 [Monomorium pharaonis]